MKILILILSLSVFVVSCITKSVKINKNEPIENEKLFKYPQIVNFKSTLNEFIPSGWAILDSASFDYDNDSLLDYVIIIETNENVKHLKMWGTEEMEMTDKPRILLVLNGTETGFTLSCQANELILTSEQGGMMGDPYQGINVSGNKICTSFWGGSNEKWGLSHCFNFQNNKWVLRSTEISGGNAELTYSMNYNFETNKFNYNYLKEEYYEANDSSAIIKKEKYTKNINIEKNILMDTFRPWTLEIDSVHF